MVHGREAHPDGDPRAGTVSNTTSYRSVYAWLSTGPSLRDCFLTETPIPSVGCDRNLGGAGSIGRFNLIDQFLVPEYLSVPRVLPLPDGVIQQPSCIEIGETVVMGRTAVMAVRNEDVKVDAIIRSVQGGRLGSSCRE